MEIPKLWFSMIARVMSPFQMCRIFCQDHSADYLLTLLLPVRVWLRRTKTSKVHLSFFFKVLTSNATFSLRCYYIMKVYSFTLTADLLL